MDSSHTASGPARAGPLSFRSHPRRLGPAARCRGVVSTLAAAHVLAARPDAVVAVGASGVVAGAAGDPVAVAVTGGDVVVACAAVEVMDTAAAAEGVVAGAAEEAVVARVTAQIVDPGAAAEY